MTSAGNPNEPEMCRWSLARVAREIRDKQVSPVEVVGHLLERIESVNGRLNAYVTVLPEKALAAAKQAEGEALAGESRGPLHGVPVALKDIFYTEGVLTSMGSAFFADHVPDHSATVATRLEEAGAILVGKTNTTEFAYGPTGDVSYFGPTRNPHDTGRITGGSSSGSGAAVAAGLCYGALGSDTGGSVRIPASCCGIVGMKPTFGRVSKHGVFPLAWSLDHVGPMTRTVEDNAILLGVLAGPDERDPHSVYRGPEDFASRLGEGIRGSAVGVPDAFYFEGLDGEVEQKVEEAVGTLVSLGAEVRPVELPNLEEVLQSYRLILASEAYAIHEERLGERPDLYSDEVRERLLAAEAFKAFEYARARRTRDAALRAFDRVFGEVEVLLAPTLPILPTEIGQRKMNLRGREELVLPTLTRLMGPMNLMGFPSLSVPCGTSSSGLPIGLQLMGRPFDEANLYRFGDAFENEVPAASPV